MEGPICLFIFRISLLLNLHVISLLYLFYYVKDVNELEAFITMCRNYIFAISYSLKI